MLNRIQFLFLCVVTGVFVMATGRIEARADEFVRHSGPVGTNDAILETFGNKRVIAFFHRDNGRCAVNAVMFEKSDTDTGMTTATRVRVSLRPNELLSFDSPDNQTLSVQCGSNAATLEVSETNQLNVSHNNVPSPGAANTSIR